MIKSLKIRLKPDKKQSFTPSYQHDSENQTLKGSNGNIEHTGNDEKQTFIQSNSRAEAV